MLLKFYINWTKIVNFILITQLVIFICPNLYQSVNAGVLKRRSIDDAVGLQENNQLSLENNEQTNDNPIATKEEKTEPATLSKESSDKSEEKDMESRESEEIILKNNMDIIKEKPKKIEKIDKLQNKEEQNLNSEESKQGKETIKLINYSKLIDQEIQQNVQKQEGNIENQSTKESLTNTIKQNTSVSNEFEQTENSLKTPTTITATIATIVDENENHIKSIDKIETTTPNLTTTTTSTQPITQGNSIEENQDNISLDSRKSKMNKLTKIINENVTNVQQFQLPQLTEVWSLAGMKKTFDSNQTTVLHATDNQWNDHSEKSLLDWQNIVMQTENNSINENLITTTTTKSPTILTTTTTTTTTTMGTFYIESSSDKSLNDILENTATNQKENDYSNNGDLNSPLEETTINDENINYSTTPTYEENTNKEENKQQLDTYYIENSKNGNETNNLETTTSKSTKTNTTIFNDTNRIFENASSEMSTTMSSTQTTSEEATLEITTLIPTTTTTTTTTIFIPTTNNTKNITIDLIKQEQIKQNVLKNNSENHLDEHLFLTTATPSIELSQANTTPTTTIQTLITPPPTTSQNILHINQTKPAEIEQIRFELNENNNTTTKTTTKQIINEQTNTLLNHIDTTTPIITTNNNTKSTSNNIKNINATVAKNFILSTTTADYDYGETEQVDDTTAATITTVKELNIKLPVTIESTTININYTQKTTPYTVTLTTTTAATKFDIPTYTKIDTIETTATTTASPIVLINKNESAVIIKQKGEVENKEEQEHIKNIESEGTLNTNVIDPLYKILNITDNTTTATSTTTTTEQMHLDITTIETNTLPSVLSTTIKNNITNKDITTEGILDEEHINNKFNLTTLSTNIIDIHDNITITTTMIPQINQFNNNNDTNDNNVYDVSTDTINVIDNDLDMIMATDLAGIVHNMPHPKVNEGTDINVIIAICVSVIGVIALLLLVAFVYLMRKRQKQMAYAQRCHPATSDAYSLDNVSIFGSMRRKGAAMRASKRIYGNAAFDDPSLRHNVLTASELSKFVEQRLSIFEEFRDVPEVTARADEVPSGCEDKNRLVFNTLIILY